MSRGSGVVWIEGRCLGSLSRLLGLLHCGFDVSTWFFGDWLGSTSHYCDALGLVALDEGLGESFESNSTISVIGVAIFFWSGHPRASESTSIWQHERSLTCFRDHNL